MLLVALTKLRLLTQYVLRSLCLLELLMFI